MKKLITIALGIAFLTTTFASERANNLNKPSNDKTKYELWQGNLKLTICNKKTANGFTNCEDGFTYENVPLKYRKVGSEIEPKSSLETARQLGIILKTRLFGSFKEKFLAVPTDSFAAPTNFILLTLKEQCSFKYDETKNMSSFNTVSKSCREFANGFVYGDKNPKISDINKDSIIKFDNDNIYVNDKKVNNINRSYILHDLRS